MADLCVRAPAKINLHLEVLGLRPDGFHELAMVMQSIDLADSLRMRPTADGQISLQCDRADLPTDSSNLVVKAAELLRAAKWCGIPWQACCPKLNLLGWRKQQASACSSGPRRSRQQPGSRWRAA